MNCAALHAADGRLSGAYRKIHLFRLFDEHLWLGEGESPTALDSPWGVTGLSICYDLRFPELFRHYAVKDQAKLILLCAEWPLARVEHWRALLKARAIENQTYVAATNACGETGGTAFGGHSMVIDPWGQVLIEGGEDEALLSAEIDLDEVDRVRQAIPVFEDRRPRCLPISAGALYLPLTSNYCHSRTYARGETLCQPWLGVFQYFGRML